MKLDTISAEEREGLQVLGNIQRALAVPKEQRNTFGGFDYRNAEDILKAVKPLLPQGYHVTTSCRPEVVGGHVYVVCSAVLSNGLFSWCADGFAREPEEKKGMDAGQISGAAISYAKKYALGNLFAIDNEKDADALAPETPAKASKTPSKAPKRENPSKGAEIDTAALTAEIKRYAAFTGEDLKAVRREIFERLPKDYTQTHIDAEARRLHTLTEEGQHLQTIAKQ